ncbi:SDR-family protein [Piptocephalis cylindrospora]|uniref:SDR-family protein n=1 Tax=Piptocephalis cylindrospora TaxID=1907219 RepID=A0A4V1IY82_9FUNG|nr:SDR-family protein [Piptocephalis cylindrospora]|eukprot:RKP13649.1 SDR-family protein [Piptocephalis cylindrospora]
MITVILGTGPGLGAALVRQFTGQGHTVVAMARRKDFLDSLCEEEAKKGGKIIGVPCDASKPESIKDAFAQIPKSDKVGCLIYNASAPFRPASILDTTPEEMEAAWKATCLGALVASQAILPGMVAQGYGTILFTGATASIRGSAKMSALAVPKFGVRALAQSIAREFGPQGIHASHILVDGVIDTEKTRQYLGDKPIPQDSLLSPSAMAQVYWQLYAQDRSVWTQELDIRPFVEKF